MYLGLKGGYLFPVVENVYVDFRLKYQMGLGDYGGDDFEDVPDEDKKMKKAHLVSILDCRYFLQKSNQP